MNNNDVICIDFGDSNLEFNEYTHNLSVKFEALKKKGKVGKLGSARKTKWVEEEDKPGDHKVKMPPGMLAVLSAVCGLDPSNLPKYADNYKTGFLETPHSQHQMIHLDSDFPGMYSWQIPLSSSGFSIQVLERHELQFMVEGKSCQSTKLHVPEYHLLVWKKDLYHSGCFGSLNFPCPRYHGSFAATPAAGERLKDENMFNQIHRIKNVEHQHYDINKIFHCDGELLESKSSS